jgi:hypothetical protein
MSSRQAPGPTQPRIQWVLRALTAEVKRLGHEDEYSSQLVPRSRKRGSMHPLPYASSWRSALLAKHRDFTLPKSTAAYRIYWLKGRPCSGKLLCMKVSCVQMRLLYIPFGWGGGGGGAEAHNCYKLTRLCVGATHIREPSVHHATSSSDIQLSKW